MDKVKMTCKVLCKVFLRITFFVMLCIIYRIWHNRAIDSFDLTMVYALAITHFILGLWKEKVKKLQKEDCEEEERKRCGTER